jgi:uncharacterized YigZ family protein
MPIIRTLSAPLRHEIPKIRGSRFIATVERTETAAAAASFISRLREEFPSATHHCFAWRLADGTLRSSDDGEPKGTAGRPILLELEGRRLSDVAVVVTRYYGGTKLGTGGLARAYGEAAGAVLDLAKIVEVPVVASLRLSYSYNLTGAVQGVLNAFDAVPGHAEYGADVMREVAVAVERVEEFRLAVTEAVSGRIAIKELSTG